nr:MAG TPA_asm: hypothetical protein [Caudoviricetes sp.]
MRCCAMGGRGGASGLSTKNQKISFKGLPTLKGSEKQVKWAEQIRDNAINTVNRNIDLANERIKKYPSAQKKYQNEIESLQEIGKQLKEVLLKVSNASQIIEKRHIFESSRILDEASKIEQRKKKR